jgi:hypothetical protein
MPKGKTPSLLSMGMGHPYQSVTQRESHCKRCNFELQKNTECFEIPTNKNGHSVSRRYCRACMKSILEQTEKDFQAIKNQLGEI